MSNQEESAAGADVRPKTKHAPPPSRTRTNKDWIMITLGVLLILFFLTSGYLGVVTTNKNSRQKIRGPVKDPDKMGMIGPSNSFPYKFTACRNSIFSLAHRS
jgi:hypothetical protein